jgi:hypothetical protein
MRGFLVCLVLLIGLTTNVFANEFSPRLTYDIGLASGSYSGKSYLELNLGLNYYFLPYLNFRNAVFYRSVTEGDAMYGLDTSMQAGSYFGITESSRLNYDIGVGYRFASKKQSAPFVVAGAMFSSSGFSLGLRVKQIYHSVHELDDEDETIVSVILAGGGTL